MSLKLIPVREIINKFGLTKYAIYSAIKYDPTFPFYQLGQKKGYRVDSEQFEFWLRRRASVTASNQNKVYTGDYLLKEYANAKR